MSLTEIQTDVRRVVLAGNPNVGKTTLFNLITRLFGTQAGTIRVCGHDLDRQPSEALARMGVVLPFTCTSTSGFLTRL